MRKHVLKKTSKPCIYIVKTRDGSKNYIVRFSYLNKRYGQKNFTKLFGTDTLKQTFEKLQEIKVELSRGNKPFKKNITMTLEAYFSEYIQGLEGKTRYSLDKYYGKHIKPIIGHFNIEDISRRHIEKILTGTLRTLANKTQSDLKLILNPIFKRAIKDKRRTDNPLEDIRFKKPQPKPELTFRVVSDLKFAVQEIYRLIEKEPDKALKAVFLIALMTGRRRSEILGLRFSDIKENKVFVPTSITKTKTPDIFPLPKEVLALIDTLPQHKDDIIFTVNSARVTRNFTKLIKESNIIFSTGSSLTLHDTRHLFQSIMIVETNNPPLVDRCLSHKQNGSMMSVYLSFSYEKRENVFKKYWDIVRGG